MPFARILVFVLAVIHGVGLADLAMADDCAESCSDDDCTRDCLPGAACRCHGASATPLLASATAAGSPAAARVVVAMAGVRPERSHASPDPREILHVPRPAS